MRASVRAAVVAVLAMTAAAAWASDDDVLAKRSFPVAEIGAFELDTDLGSVEVRGTSARTVDVEVVFDADRMGRREAERFRDRFRIDFDAASDRVTVRARRGDHASWWSRLTSSVTVRFTIAVPTGFSVDLRTSGGSVEVADVDGSVRARTSGGSLRFGSLGGSVWGRTSGGSITLEECRGEADVDTSGGSIRIGRVDGPVRAETSGGSITIDQARGTVDAHTSGGGIRVQEVKGAIDASTSGGSIRATITEQPGADCHLSTSGGSVDVYLSGGVAVDVDARGNRVSSDLKIEPTGPYTKSRKVGTINGGGPLLELRTSGGSVRIHRR